MPDKTEIGIWRAQVDRFRRDCEQSSVDQEGERLREAMRLVPVEMNASAFDALIAQGAFASAALAVIGAGTPFMLSRSSEGHCLATIAGQGVEVIAEGVSPALALLGAWAAALLARTTASCQTFDVSMAAAPGRLH